MTASHEMPEPPALSCEWERHRTGRCGATPATWSVTMHDTMSTDPSAVTVYIMCAECAHKLLTWAQREHRKGAGTYCRGCNTLFAPTLGAFILGHAELDHPERDTRYDRSQ